MKKKKLIRRAADVVRLFDEANRKKVIEKSGERGAILKRAIDRLRHTLDNGKRPAGRTH